MKFPKIILALAATLFHITSLVLLFLAFKPIVHWYFSKIPILGVDFFNSVGYVSYLAKDLPLPINSFKDFWFGGYPLFREFVSLHWYAMIPFYNKFGPVLGIQIYVMVALFLFACASYFLFFQLSKSRALSVILAFLVLYSVNIYGAATWGGSLPFFSTQLFLPLLLAILDKYIVSGNNRFFLAAILVSGIGYMSHPLPMFAFALPTASILLFFGFKKTGDNIFWAFLKRIRIVAIFAIGSLLVGFPVSYERLYFTLNSLIRGGFSVLFAFITPPGDGGAGGSSVGSAASSDIAVFYQSLTKLLYTETNIWLFYLLGLGTVLFLITFIQSRRLSMFLRVLPYILMSGYGVLHTFANAYGFSFFPQGWYREFWAFPILLGALVAILWGQFFDLIRDKLKSENIVLRFVLINLPFLALSLIFFAIGYLFFTTKSQSIIATIESKSEISSAHPQALSIRTSKSELAETKRRLLPEFIDPSDKNKRLYEADALVNIWWSSLYDTPLARGYIDPPIGISDRGGFFWLDIAIANDSLVRDFKVPEEIAFNNSLFLIDWYGIYYYEGGRVAVSTSVGPSSYLVNNNIFDANEQTTVYGALIKWQTDSGKPELHPEVPQYLNFYKVRDEFTSPILYPTKASTILVFSDKGGYEDLMRGLAASNLNSRYVIAVNGGKFIDDMIDADFKNFDAVILHGYDYHNEKKAIQLVSNFVKGGGKLFVDTGVESKQSQGKKLPDIFPIKSSIREGLGREWNLEVASDPITEGVDFSKFSPPDFNNSDWKLAHPKNEGDLREGAITLLKQRGKPILVKARYGEGQVIWSGLNFLYHLSQFKNVEENKFFANIVKQLVPINKNDVIAARTKWSKPEEVTIASDFGARGLVFKEQAYNGWSAKLISPTAKKLSIYKVGPTYPGFIYVPLPREEPFNVQFSYNAEFKPIFIFGTSALLIIYLLDQILFSGKLFVHRFNFFRGVAGKKVGSWWEKEEV